MTKTKLTGIGVLDAEKNRVSYNNKLRIASCAYMLIGNMSNRQWLKLNKIMYGKEYTWFDAACIAIMASCKALKKAGQVENYRQALDIVESRQVGDTCISLNPPNATSRTVARINRANHGYNPHKVDLQAVLRYGIIGAWLHSTGDPAYYVGHVDIVTIGKNVQYVYNSEDLMPIYPHVEAKKAREEYREIQYGKVAGELIAQYDQAQAQLEPAYIERRKEIIAWYPRASDHLSRYFADYVSRLSPTIQASLRAIISSEFLADVIFSTKAKYSDNAQLRSYFKKATRLYEAFPHRDSIDRIQWLGLLRQYADSPVIQCEFRPSSPILC